MENILLWKNRFTPPIHHMEYSEDYIKIGNILIKQYHDQSCCENVYAEFDAMKYYIENINAKYIYEIEIKAVPDIGFIIFFYTNDQEDHNRIGCLIPCYNIQNGYYDDDLSLIIKYRNKDEHINISKCTQFIPG